MKNRETKRTIQLLNELSLVSLTGILYEKRKFILGLSLATAIVVFVFLKFLTPTKTSYTYDFHLIEGSLSGDSQIASDITSVAGQILLTLKSDKKVGLGDPDSKEAKPARTFLSVSSETLPALQPGVSSIEVQRITLTFKGAELDNPSSFIEEAARSKITPLIKQHLLLHANAKALGKIRMSLINIEDKIGKWRDQLAIATNQLAQIKNLTNVATYNDESMGSLSMIQPKEIPLKDQAAQSKLDYAAPESTWKYLSKPGFVSALHAYISEATAQLYVLEAKAEARRTFRRELAKVVFLNPQERETAWNSFLKELSQSQNGLIKSEIMSLAKSMETTWKDIEGRVIEPRTPRAIEVSNQSPTKTTLLTFLASLFCFSFLSVLWQIHCLSRRSNTTT